MIIICDNSMNVCRVLTRIGGAAARHPATGLGVHLVHLVVLDRSAAIVEGALPLELAALVVHVRDLERTLGRGRLVRHHHVDGDHVLARGVGGSHRELARVLATRGTDHQLGVVVRVVDRHPLAVPEDPSGRMAH